MRPYFEKMPEFGRELNKGQIASSEENVKLIKDVEAEIEAEVEKVKLLGFPEEKSNARGQRTVCQRRRDLVDPSSIAPALR